MDRNFKGGDMNIYQKLATVQTELKCQKSQYNNFGKYKYRNLEDIMEAVKPLLLKNSLAMIVSDEIINIGDRFYIKATATIINAEKPDETIQATALARESLNKKGMDDSQITGTASSYARKHCLNGLYAIDDTKDADSMDNATNESHSLTHFQVKEIMDLLEASQADKDAFFKFAGATDINGIHPSKFNQLKSMLLAKKAKAGVS